MLFSRANTLLSFPMLLSMVAAQKSILRYNFFFFLFPKFYNLLLKNFKIGEATKIEE